MSYGNYINLPENIFDDQLGPIGPKGDTGPRGYTGEFNGKVSVDLIPTGTEINIGSESFKFNNI